MCTSLTLTLHSKKEFVFSFGKAKLAVFSRFSFLKFTDLSWAKEELWLKFETRGRREYQCLLSNLVFPNQGSRETLGSFEYLKKFNKIFKKICRNICFNNSLNIVHCAKFNTILDRKKHLKEQLHLNLG